MSVTFSCPQAPSKTERVPCDSPSYGLTCTAEERCGYCEDGMMWSRTCEAPEVNFANGNAAGILNLLGMSWEPFGDIPANDVPVVLRRILRVLNVESDRAHLVSESTDGFAFEEPILVEDDGVTRITRGCRVIRCGNTDEQTTRRLLGLQDLLVYAADRGFSVSWG